MGEQREYQDLVYVGSEAHAKRLSDFFYKKLQEHLMPTRQISGPVAPPEPKPPRQVLNWRDPGERAQIRHYINDMIDARLALTPPVSVTWADGDHEIRVCGAEGGVIAPIDPHQLVRKWEPKQLERFARQVAERLARGLPSQVPRSYCWLDDARAMGETWDRIVAQRISGLLSTHWEGSVLVVERPDGQQCAIDALRELRISADTPLSEASLRAAREELANLAEQRLSTPRPDPWASAVGVSPIRSLSSIAGEWIAEWGEGDTACGALIELRMGAALRFTPWPDKDKPLPPWAPALDEPLSLRDGVLVPTWNGMAGGFLVGGCLLFPEWRGDVLILARPGLGELSAALTAQQWASGGITLPVVEGGLREEESWKPQWQRRPMEPISSPPFRAKIIVNGQVIGMGIVTHHADGRRTVTDDTTGISVTFDADGKLLGSGPPRLRQDSVSFVPSPKPSPELQAKIDATVARMQALYNPSAPEPREPEPAWTWCMSCGKPGPKDGICLGCGLPLRV